MNAKIKLAGMAWTLFVLASCDGRKNVTIDPTYNFKAMVGTSWKLKKPIALQAMARDAMGYGNICTEEYAAQFVAGTANLNAYGIPVVDILPSGTVVDVFGLVTGSSRMGGLIINLIIQDGKYKGYYLQSPQELFLPNYFTDKVKSQSKTWKVDPDILEKP